VSNAYTSPTSRASWLQGASDRRRGASVSADLKKLLKRLTDAETLEKFLHTRHVGRSVSR
jgi:2-oxoglutarate dehydrogenase E1 component